MRGVVAALVLILVGGCGFGDSALSVRNDTESAWLIRSPAGDPYPDEVLIMRIEPHSEGIVATWRGQRDFSIELLDLSCAPVGSFESTGGQIYTVASTPGISGKETTIGLFPRNVEGQPNPVQDCGGFILL